MALAALSTLRLPVVAALPSPADVGDAVVLAADGHLYVYDGATWIDTGASGGSGATGLTTIDFGAAPGTTDAIVTITGQAAIGAGARVRAWIEGRATADHSIDEHFVEPLRVIAGNVVAGVGFTIYAICDLGRTCGVFSVGWEWN